MLTLIFIIQKCLRSELGIPAVVGITGLIDNLHDGDMVEFDGTTGIVRKI